MIVIAAVVVILVLFVAIALFVHSHRQKAFLRADEERALAAAQSSIKQGAIITNQAYEPYHKEAALLSDEGGGAAALPSNRTLLYFGDNIDVYHPGATPSNVQRAQQATEESNLELEKSTQESDRWIDVLHNVFGNTLGKGGESSLEGAREQTADLLASIQSLLSGATSPTAVASPPTDWSPVAPDAQAAVAPSTPAGPPVSGADVCTHLGNCTCPNCR
jgi:hypothetical protein